MEVVRNVSRHVALAVGAAAQEAGLAESTTREELERRVGTMMWTPRYLPMRPKLV